MAPLALALQLALAAAPAPSLAPPLDAGPSFRGAELALASAGVLAGDVAVLGGGYLTLQLFASGAFSPDATSFRRAAYVLAGAALVVPPLTAVLLARLSGRAPGAGTFWKGLLLASVGHLAAFGAGYLAAPHFWVMLPVQLVAVAAGTSLGFHWGRATARRASPSLPPKPSAAPALPTATGGGEPHEPPPTASRFPLPICPDV